ncbi:hypothetical protein GCM10017744_000820 [Streptomyces antimycoticus]|uniref:Uncharacterized protein n=1 Tax=Streptomyces antimycoticus TaxID=68175 RepID=A0A4D4KKI2_9ACTN|nr:hypothetical protein SANT12839_098840 [Streptomyces antimycoticus]
MAQVALVPDEGAVQEFVAAGLDPALHKEAVRAAHAIQSRSGRALALAELVGVLVTVPVQSDSSRSLSGCSSGSRARTRESSRSFLACLE